jgi:hypothetical protein
VLADSSPVSIGAGVFARDVQRPAGFRRNLIGFIAQELPKWRDHPLRRPETAETLLTSQLCAHLNSATRLSPGWDILQFRVEEPDEQHRGRKIDLVPSASGATIWIEGRAHSHYDSLLPIECKRLPVPADPRRDAREYLHSALSTTGGIQRFKAGHHGGAHDEALMIAYVQSDTLDQWVERMGDWVAALVADNGLDWTDSEALRSVARPDPLLMRLESTHARAGALSAIQISHLWIDMAAPSRATANPTRPEVRSATGPGA